MAWSALSADRPLPNEGALRFGLGAAALPLWAPFLAAAGAGLTWWWATAWTRQAMTSGFAPATIAPRRIEVRTTAPEPVAAPAAQAETPVQTMAVSAEVAEVAADVHAVAALETAPITSDAEAVKAAVAEVVAGTRAGGDGPRPARKKPAGPKATV